jgi:hypothetical protein
MNVKYECVLTTRDWHSASYEKWATFSSLIVQLRGEHFYGDLSVALRVWLITISGSYPAMSMYAMYVF